MFTRLILGAAFALAAVGANAATCTGSCGSLGADGDVTAPPSGPTYNYVTTNGGFVGVGTIDGIIGSGSEVNGSEYSIDFTANANDQLSFYFNYVTSDGAGFADYAWAELVDGVGDHVAWLFTGRTTDIVGGDTSPGFGLPTNDSTLIPAGSPIIGSFPDDGPIWSPLGVWSGECFDIGCGYTGWIQSLYTIADAGNYSIIFGVTNWTDDLYDSGLAFAGTKIGDVIIQPPGTPAVPLPASGILLAAVFGAFGGAASLRKRRNKAT